MPSLTEKEEAPSAAEATVDGQMLLLTVSPGKLGLTIRVDKTLGGCTITAIDPACTFKDRVEVGDRIVTIDGQKVTKIADLQINNTKQRQFGVVKKIQQTTQNQQAPPSSTQMTPGNAALTPLANNTRGNPVVTTEKTTTTKKNANKQNEADETLVDHYFQVLITCPDGSKINLSSDQRNNKDNCSHIVLGRGKHGIPFTSRVPIQACALRIVEKYLINDDASSPFAVELVALGMERCTVLRDGNPLFVMSVAQMLRSGMNTTCPSSIVLRNGDRILPFDQEVSNLTDTTLYKFKIESVAGRALPATGESDDALVADGSAFAAASKKINEAAAMGTGNGEMRQGNPYVNMPEANAGGKSSEGGEEADVAHNPFDFDKESLRRTFLGKPSPTASFFYAYYRTLSKKKSANGSTELGNNVLFAFIDAMSPQDKSSFDANMVLSGSVDSFPLKQLLDVLLQDKHTELGKRAIEGYIWLSCRKFKGKLHGRVSTYEPSGPILMANQNFPLNSMCNQMGWGNLEALLVESMEMLCKYQHNPIRSFALLEKIEPTASSGPEDAAQMRVLYRLAKVAYEKWFTADPETIAAKFVELNHRFRQKSHHASVKLINAFVDAMSPTDSACRRVPMKTVRHYFPLNSILSAILVDGKHKELGKRVLEGYVWLSSQKCSDSSLKPRGPVLLATALDRTYNKIGWDLLADVLVESVKKLCELDNMSDAFNLMEKITGASSRGDDSQCSLVCTRLAKLTSKMFNIDRFLSKPNATAKLFLTQYKHLEKDPSNKQFCSELLNSFVDIMSPRDPKCRREPSHSMDREFPLKDILSLLVDGRLMELGKRVLEGYVWLSSQRVACYTCGGPRLLDTVDVPLVKLCETLGWNEMNDVLVESVKMLCKHRNTEEAVLFVDKIAPAVSEGSSHRLRICSKMAKIACDEEIKRLDDARRYKSANDFLRYKKLLWLVGNYCPTIAPKFVTLAKKLDVDAILYPLLTDIGLRSSSSADAMKTTMSELTNHCAQLLNSRVGSDPDTVTAWTISNPDLYANFEFGEFLQSQCKKIFDWKVRKSDHRGFEAALQHLIDAGEIRCLSHQPGYTGAYYFKITKLKTCRVALSDLSCSCSTEHMNFDMKITQEPSSCLRHSSQWERREDKKKLDAIKAYLPADSILKRKADVLGADDDDEVILTGVTNVAETVAKRVKAAEDAGEVIEIL